MSGLESNETLVQKPLGPIQLVEYGSSDPLDERQCRALQAASEVRKRLGLTLALDGFGVQPVVRLKAGPIVGAACVECEGGAFTVHIAPKVTNANFLTMFDYAYRPDQMTEPLRLDDPIALAQLAGNVTGLVILFFLFRLEEFIRRHLRRDYVLRRESLNSRVRGKILTQEYVGRSLPRLRDYIVPCQFSELSRDTLSNRILLWTLHLCARAAAAFSPEQRRVLLPRIMARWQSLGGITLMPIHLSDFSRVHYTGLHAVYRPIHTLCRFLIEQLQFENVAGEAEFREFRLDMNDLFERFVRGVLRRHLGPRFVADKSQLERHYSIGEQNWRKSITLDGLIRDEAGRPRCIVECKYHEVWEEVPDRDAFVFSGGRLRNSEVFQTIAYATHRDLHVPAAVLVYPVTDGTPSMLGPLRDFGLRPGGGDPVSLYIVGINVGQDLSEGTAAFVEQIRLIEGAITNVGQESPVGSALSTSAPTTPATLIQAGVHSS